MRGLLRGNNLIPGNVLSDPDWAKAAEAVDDLDALTEEAIRELLFLNNPGLTTEPLRVAKSRYAIVDDGAPVREIRKAAHIAPQVTRKMLSWDFLWKDRVEVITGQQAVIWLGPSAPVTGAGTPVGVGYEQLPLGFVMINLGYDAPAPVLDAIEKLLIPVSGAPVFFYLGRVLNSGITSFVLGQDELGDPLVVLGEPPLEYFLISRKLYGAP